MSFFSTFTENLLFILSNLRIQDLIDIILVWLIIYRVLILIKRSGTVQMLSGLGILAITYIASIWFELYTLNWILEKFFSNLFVIVVVLFQGEIRRALHILAVIRYFLMCRLQWKLIWSKKLPKA